MAAPNPVNLINAAYGADIRNLEENMTPPQVAHVVNRIKNHLNFRTLRDVELNSIIDYTANHIVNKDVKNILLETINLIKGRNPSKATRHGTPRVQAEGHIRPGRIRIIRKNIPGIGFIPAIIAPTQDIATTDEEFEKLDEKYVRERNNANRLKSDRKRSDAAISFVGDLEEVLANNDIFSRLSRRDVEVYLREKAKIFTRNNTRQNMTNSRQKMLAANKIKDFIAWKIRILEGVAAPILRSGVRAEKKVEIADLPTTKQNLKQFTADLKRERERLARQENKSLSKLSKSIRKGLAIHSP
ncbi:MAG: hypothetical protein GY756_20370, partial [bacterium]|nr:hypothetical protein [bacterium]